MLDLLSKIETETTSLTDKGAIETGTTDWKKRVTKFYFSVTWTLKVS